MKAKIIFAILTGIILTVFFLGCELGDGNITSDKRKVGDFDSITLEGVGNVIVHEGTYNLVVVTTDSNLQDKIVTKTSGSNLMITQTKGSFNSTELTIDVYVTSLKRVSLSGAGNITIKSGSASDFECTLSGAGNIDAEKFQVQNMTIYHSGVGNAKVWVVKSMSGSLSGVGNINYKGSPSIYINKTGIGNLSRL